MATAKKPAAPAPGAAALGAASSGAASSGAPSSGAAASGAGSKAKYTDKQKRKAGHIAEGYAKSGLPEQEAEARAWATVNAQDGGGKKPGGSGRRKPADKKHSEAAA